MNILVIAPDHADLPDAASEIAAIQRYHQAVILSGPVRERDIERAADEGPYEIIWWISHGSQAGILLTDGALSIVGVGQYVRRSHAQLCVLNTCDSELAALSIAARGECDVICTIGPVLNQDAIRLGSLLAGELANCDDFYDAYEIVAPSGGPYRYLRATAQYRRYNSAAAAENMRTQIAIIVLTTIVLLGGLGLYREILLVEDRQLRIITNQERIMSNQERELESVRNLESRLVRLQLAHDIGRGAEGGP